MKNIDSFGQLNFIVMEIVKDALKDVGVFVENRMRSFIDQDVYVGQNEYYQNTYQFRESVESSSVSVVGTNAEVKIGHNIDKMTSDPDNFTHGSNFYQPNDIRKYLPEILAFNQSGDFFGSNQWWHNRDNYFYDTLESLSKNGELVKVFMTALRKRGLDVK